MKNKLAFIGGIAVLFALVLAPLAAASDHHDPDSPAGGGYKQPVAPGMTFGAPSMKIGTTVTADPPSSVEPTPFAHPAL